MGKSRRVLRGVAGDMMSSMTDITLKVKPLHLFRGRSDGESGHLGMSHFYAVIAPSAEKLRNRSPFVAEEASRVLLHVARIAKKDPEKSETANQGKRILQNEI